MKASVETTFIDFEDRRIPAKIYRERRKNVRFSIGKKYAICRMPTMMLPLEQANQIKRFEEWVIKHFSKNERIQSNYFGKDYKDGDLLKVGEREYIIRLIPSQKKMHHAKLKGNEIFLEIAKDTPENKVKAIRHLLSRVVAKDFLPEITKKVDTWNDAHFQKDLTGIFLKYNTTNWGSCSTRGNVNLSTRLLFAPNDVIDYVIVHELSHLIEMNHSDRFWKIVSDIMPDYREKEIWLKKNGHLCNF
jgi:predicted metal-dependent hydrolase